MAGRTPRTYSFENLRFPLKEDDNDFLPRLWATRRVGWLMEQIRTNGEQKELRDEIVDLGTRYGIVTPYTSYSALEDARTVTQYPGGQVQNRAPLGGFHSVSAPQNGRTDASEVTGADAVQ